jgi:carbamoyltransferase
MSVILGINTHHAGSAASVVIDGVPVVALAEERLNRVKYYAGFPALAIATCLETAGLTFADIDAVAVGRDSSANLHRKLEFALCHPTRLLNLARLRRKSQTFDDLASVMASECGVDRATLRATVYNVEHHLAHTASAYFMSPWDRCAGVTIDGSGDFVSCMLSECVGSEIRPLKRIFVPHSLGTLYTALCQFIGYPHYGDEGKVMGLAPLGTDRYHDVFDRLLTPTDDGFELNPDYFLPFGANQGLEINDAGQMVVPRLYSDRLVKELGEPREKDGELTQRDQDIACGLQRVFERYYMHLLRVLHRSAPTERIAMAGGCVLNSVANGKLLLDTPFRQTCIQPAAGDDGLALGAALYVSNAILREGRRWEMKDAYLGNDFADAFVKRELDRYGVAYRQLDRAQLLEVTADGIMAGNVVGWFQGRMEWGPRALGNRSILAHPGFPDMKDTLNARVKHREAFRPFAPSVLRERQSEVFEQDHPSPFMLHVYTIRPEWRERLSAVTHVDGTGRLQTVARDENPLYYDLISAFERRSGIPVLLNTSFNENEPVVCQPSEAIECFLRTRMDVLVIGSFYCSKAVPRGAPAV